MNDCIFITIMLCIMPFGASALEPTTTNKLANSVPTASAFDNASVALENNADGLMARNFALLQRSLSPFSYLRSTFFANPASPVDDDTPSAATEFSQPDHASVAAIVDSPLPPCELTEMENSAEDMEFVYAGLVCRTHLVLLLAWLPFACIAYLMLQQQEQASSLKPIESHKPTMTPLVPEPIAPTSLPVPPTPSPCEPECTKESIKPNVEKCDEQVKLPETDVAENKKEAAKTGTTKLISCEEMVTAWNAETKNDEHVISEVVVEEEPINEMEEKNSVAQFDFDLSKLRLGESENVAGVWNMESPEPVVSEQNSLEFFNVSAMENCVDSLKSMVLNNQVEEFLTEASYVLKEMKQALKGYEAPKVLQNMRFRLKQDIAYLLISKIGTLKQACLDQHVLEDKKVSWYKKPWKGHKCRKHSRTLKAMTSQSDNLTLLKQVAATLTTFHYFARRSEGKEVNICQYESILKSI